MRIWTEEELQLLETLANELRTQNQTIKIFEIVTIIKNYFENKTAKELQDELYRLELQNNPEKLEEAQVRFTKHQKCKIKSQQYREEHKEQIAAKWRQYYQKYKEEILAKTRQYYEEHKGDTVFTWQQYYINNKEEILNKRRLQRIWSKENLNLLKNYINETNKEELFTEENIQLFSNETGKPHFIIKEKINSLLKEQEKELKKANIALTQLNSKDLLQK